MELLELLKKRKSVRKYLDIPIEDEKIQAILEAARIAPTSGNTQKFKIIPLSSQLALNKLQKAANFYNAPLVFIICADHTNEWHRPYDQKTLSDIDASIITDHMMLTATSLGLGSVWICYFNPSIIIHEFCLPCDIEPINILAIGYSDNSEPNNPLHSIRKPLDELLYNVE